MLSYGIHDLQEAGILPGLDNLAFDVSDTIPPSTWYGTLLKGIFNFSPVTTWLEAARLAALRRADADALPPVRPPPTRPPSRLRACRAPGCLTPPPEGTNIVMRPTLLLAVVLAVARSRRLHRERHRPAAEGDDVAGARGR